MFREVAGSDSIIVVLKRHCPAVRDETEKGKEKKGKETYCKCLGNRQGARREASSLPPEGPGLGLCEGGSIVLGPGGIIVIVVSSRDHRCPARVQDEMEQ